MVIKSDRGHVDLRLQCITPPTPDRWFSVLNSILRNLSELGLTVQQFQSDQEEVVQQGGAGDDIALF